MKIPTKITEMLRIDYPIIGAPMFLVSYPDLVVSVSEAGGIGCFPALNYRTIEDLKHGLEEIRSRTKKPIGVNIILHKDHNPYWRKQFDVCLEYKVELIITSLGSPRSIVNEAKSVGAKVFCDVTTLRHAQLVAKAGADALIAVCWGAGGHGGTISPFVLIPQLKEETGLPVVAAGAITTGRQMAAALALGADAVYVGTRFIATPESKASEEYKQMILESTAEELVYTDEVSGIPANWLKKSLEKAKITKPATIVGKNPTEEEIEKEYKRWRDIWSAGQGISLIKDIQPAKDIIASMVDEYLNIIKTLPQAVYALD
ncbi:MAG: nitronate monooxygenase [Leptospiraceae bacterium]|nr:nitronate monooxygenase [Leptospiraceae bacterium]MDW7975384.1 nitronate monooxygenase [Leptospiraceae bacterium]